MRNPLIRAWRRLRANGRRSAKVTSIIDRTGFWCERHRQMREQLGVDVIAATDAISLGLRMAGIEPGPTRAACCHFTDETVQGVLRLTKAAQER